MKKTYSILEMELKIFGTEDIIRTSNPDIPTEDNELPPIWING